MTTITADAGAMQQQQQQQQLINQHSPHLVEICQQIITLFINFSRDADNITALLQMNVQNIDSRIKCKLLKKFSVDIFYDYPPSSKNNKITVNYFEVDTNTATFNKKKEHVAISLNEIENQQFFNTIKKACQDANILFTNKKNGLSVYPVIKARLF
jgi:hypothetical protein